MRLTQTPAEYHGYAIWFAVPDVALRTNAAIRGAVSSFSANPVAQRESWNRSMEAGPLPFVPASSP